MEGANLYAVFRKISTGDYKPLSKMKFSKVLCTLVSKMLSTNPASRPTVEEVSKTVARVLDALGPSAGPDASERLSESLCDHIRVLELESDKFKGTFKVSYYSHFFCCFVYSVKLKY